MALSITYDSEMREQLEAEIKKANEDVSRLVEEYNAALLDEEMDTMRAKEATIAESLTKIKSNTLLLLYDDCKLAGITDSGEIDRTAIMRYAIMHNAFSVTSVKDVPIDKGSTLKKKEVGTKDLYIDLLDLHAKVTGGIGADTKWTHALTKLNMLMTIDEHITIRQKDEKMTDKTKGELTREVGSSFAISDIAKQFDFGQNPTSTKNMRATLQKLADMMIGEVEWKIGKKDVGFLSYTHCSNGKRPGTLASVRDKTMCFSIMGILEKLMKQEAYDHEYQKKKD